MIIRGALWSKRGELYPISQDWSTCNRPASPIAVKLLRLCHIVGNIFATAIEVNPVTGLRPDRHGAAIHAI